MRHVRLDLFLHQVESCVEHGVLGIQSATRDTARFQQQGEESTRDQQPPDHDCEGGGGAEERGAASAAGAPPRDERHDEETQRQDAHQEQRTVGGVVGGARASGRLGLEAAVQEGALLLQDAVQQPQRPRPCLGTGRLPCAPTAQRVGVVAFQHNR